jgi:hypothetical protein
MTLGKETSSPSLTDAVVCKITLISSAGRGHAPQGPQPGWVQELIAESRSAERKSQGDQSHSASVIRSLPRTAEQMGYALDGTDFWSTFGIAPDVPWVD